MSRFALGILGLSLAVAIGWGVWPSTAQGPNFDRLSDTDRAAFATRFEKEIWPLLQRNGKDGCLGCHQLKHPSSMRLSSDIKRDFPFLLTNGFFLVEDPAALLHMVSAKDPAERMPPGKRPSWTPAEVQTLRQFVQDLDKKQQKK